MAIFGGNYDRVELGLVPVETHCQDGGLIASVLIRVVVEHSLQVHVAVEELVLHRVLLELLGQHVALFLLERVRVGREELYQVADDLALLDTGGFCGEAPDHALGDFHGNGVIHLELQEEVQTGASVLGSSLYVGVDQFYLGDSESVATLAAAPHAHLVGVGAQLVAVDHLVAGGQLAHLFRDDVRHGNVRDGAAKRQELEFGQQCGLYGVHDGCHVLVALGRQTLEALPRLDLANLCDVLHRLFELRDVRGHLGGINQPGLRYGHVEGLIDELHQFVGVCEQCTRRLVVVRVLLLHVHVVYGVFVLVQEGPLCPHAHH